MQIPERDAPPFLPQLLLKKMGNNQDIFRAVVVAMRQDLDVRMAKLVLAQTQRDRLTARAESHALKGALGEVTATSAAYLAGILERAADASDWETFDLAFGAFQQDAQLLKTAIEAHLSALDGASSAVGKRPYSAPGNPERFH
jgi:HPt (histidine-containing phosphotransfer) domain-containing protein